MEKLKVPGNVMMFNSFIVTIATFDLIPTDWIANALYYLPEEEPFNMHFS